MPHEFEFSTETNAKGQTVHLAQLKGSTAGRFVVGIRAKYDGSNFGLMSDPKSKDPAFTYKDFTALHGFWAIFIHPTAMAEAAGRYSTINTYDRAFFTWGFMQFAAHVPNGDFVKFFRKLLSFANAADYFPKLALKDGHIHFKNSNGTLDILEDTDSSQKLMEYLNPTVKEVEKQELVCAARMVHWANNDPNHRMQMVQSGIDLYRRNMGTYDTWYGLNGAPAKVCLVICDIHHQGRAKKVAVKAALNTGGDWAKAYENLLAIGQDDYPSRIKTIGTTIADLEAKGLMAKTWNRAKKEFV